MDNSKPEARALDIEPGTIVANRYRILRPLGRGGMGEVFAAENTRTGRHVAIKLLHADAKTKASSVERFRREARASGSINSDYVTQVLDVEDDPVYGIVLVFELLEGESLIDRLKRTGPLSFEELHPIIEQVWMGLADAHRVGIIHRDLKPSNVFLESRPDGSTRVKILDFGISKLPKEMEGNTLTEMGQSLGTFSFMPPEQIGKAKTVDHRADIYAAATLIYQSLTGQLPYIAKNVLVMVELKAKQPARTLAEALEAQVDPRLELFMAKGLARSADDRFQTAMDALAAWRELSPRASGPSRSSGAAPAQVPWSQPPPVAAQAVVSRPPPPVAEYPTRNDLRPAPPVAAPPIYNETTTDDVVETVAMPRRLLTNGQMPPPAALSPALASTAPMQIQSPLHQSGGYPGAAGSGTYGSVQSQPSAYGHQAPAQQQPAYSNVPPTQAMQAYPPQGWPGSAAPPNPGQWRQQTGPNMPTVDAQTAEQTLPQKRPIPLLFWGIVAAVLGFAIVGVLLLLTR